MSKIIVKDFWIQKIENNCTTVGFNRQALSQLGQIWQFIPRVRVGDKINTGQAIASIETTTELKSLITPVEGVLLNLNEDVILRPEEIQESTILFTISKVNNALFGL